MATPNDTPQKQCSKKEKCVNPRGSLQPATKEHFREDKANKCGFRSECRACGREYSRQYIAEHPVETRKRNCAWRATHRSEIRENSRRWRAEHPDETREYVRRWRVNHPEEARKACSDYYAEHRDEIRITQHKRRTLEQRLPYAFSRSNEVRMHEYWGYRCAVCGERAGLWTLLAADHWIAVTDKRTDNPGTVPSNMIPLCHAKKGVPAGTVCCNNSKWKKDPEQWLVGRFGKRKASLIMKRINTYFEWVKEQDCAT